MIPSTTGFLDKDFEITQQPTYTHLMQLDNKVIRGYTDGQEAMRQAIFKILQTERYQYVIYSWNYGIETLDLYGQPVAWVCPELSAGSRKPSLVMIGSQAFRTSILTRPKRRGALHLYRPYHLWRCSSRKRGEFLMYEGETHEVILDRMLKRVSDKFDKREGSILWDTHSPTAFEFQLLYIELDTILREAYGDTASREFLIRRCKERGIAPDEATHAILKGEFTPKNIDVTGKRFNISSLNFKVVERIADGEYKVECETPGVVGNQQLGTMIPIEYIEGLETAELTGVLIPGEDEENTEALRKRYFDSFNEKAFGGNVQDYLAKTNGIPGVGSTKVTRVWNSDISPRP